MVSMKGIHWTAASGALAVLAFIAGTATGYAQADPLYGGRANGAGVPVTRAAGTDPGALPGGAALAAQSEKFDSDLLYGGLHLNEAVAVEAAQRRPFGDAGKPGDQALSLAGKVKLPVTDEWSVTGKMGVQYSGAIGSPGSAEPGPNGYSPVYGLGLSYEITRGLELRAESERVLPRAGDPKSVTGDSVLVGARLRF
jgi:hypothetical protein